MSAESESVVKAKQQLKRALNLYKSGDRTGALKALGNALELDMTLRYDDEVRRLAGKMTGLPPDEAVDKLGSFFHRTSLITQKRKSKSAGNSLSMPVLVGGAVVGLVLVAVGAFFLFTQVIPQLLLPGARVEQRGGAGFEYYVATPGGFAPETGWPTLVVVHGVGMNGKMMVDAFQQVAQTAGVLIIAPTFANMPYGQYYDDGSDFFMDARFQMQGILDDLQTAGFQSPDLFPHFLGQVYLGYGEGADLVSYLAQTGLDYSDSGFALEGPIGVVLANGRYDFQPTFYQPYFIADVALTPDVLNQAIAFTQEIYLPYN
jgi:hypothetical protein